MGENLQAIFKLGTENFVTYSKGAIKEDCARTGGIFAVRILVVEMARSDYEARSELQFKHW
jgi:hypothetical protein